MYYYVKKQQGKRFKTEMKCIILESIEPRTAFPMSSK